MGFYNSLISKLLPDFDSSDKKRDYKRTATVNRYPNMQGYVEKRLTEVHYNAVDFNLCQKLGGIVAAVLFIILMPYLHIGLFYLKIWVPDKPKVDRTGCTCSCFDTVFRGQYEMPGQVPYKHVYFNATANTFKIWIMTVIFLILFYESAKYLAHVYQTSSFRRPWLFLYIINLYPHYYSWWSFFSYYNEEFYTFFTHHMFFSVTEIMVTAIVLNLCNKRNEIKTWKIMSIIAINLVHIIVSGSDQFIAHVLQGYGQKFQNARNIGLMIPDMLHVVIPAYEFYWYIKKSDKELADMCYKEEIIMFIVFISLGTIFGRLI